MNSKTQLNDNDKTTTYMADQKKTELIEAGSDTLWRGSGSHITLLLANFHVEMEDSNIKMRWNKGVAEIKLRT